MTTINSPEAFLAEMFARPVKIDGQQMTTREAYIRAIHAKAISGDVDSHVELDRMRRACGADEVASCGYLVVPEPLPLDEWEKRAAEQQRPFREKPDGQDC